MSLNKTDLVFGLSVAGLIWNYVQGQVHQLVSPHASMWLNITFTAIAILAYALYEKMQGIPVAPSLPQQTP